MVQPIFNTYTPSTASLTGFASAVSGLSWALTATAAPDALAHQLTLQNNSGTDYSGHNFTIVGFDQDLKAQTQTIAMPAGSATVTSSLYWSSLTSVTPSVTTNADTMNIGYAATFSSRTIPLDWGGNLPFVSVAISGTINYTFQYTGDNIQGQPPTYAPATPPYNWQSDAGTAIVSSVATASETLTSTPMAGRLIVNSYSAGAKILYFTISQMARPR